MRENRDILIYKLDEFIRRYYKNQLVKGAIYSVGILLLAFLSVVFLEYFGELNSFFRGFLFFGFLLSGFLVLIKYIFIPFLKLYRIGKIITYDEAAGIIGRHFNNVQDKLLNVLQLQSSQHLQGSEDLLLAGINQKISQLQPIPFSSAINFSENKRYLRIVLPIFLLTLSIAVLWPQIISKSTERLVHYQTYYEKEMPFQFKIQNIKLETIQTRDFELQLLMDGNQVPNEVHILLNGIQYKLDKENASSFTFIFSNPQVNTKFQFEAAGYLSKEFELSVLPKPSLLNFNLELVYPAYLNKGKEVILNTGDVQIPQGTKINWLFKTKNTQALILKFSDSTAMPKQIAEDQFGFSRKFNQNNNYTIKTINQFVTQAPDSVNYNIQVVLDQYPAIEVEEKQDSLNLKNSYFSGMIRDDYGFKQLLFHYTVFQNDSNAIQRVNTSEVALPVLKAQISQPFYYFLDAAVFNLLPGDRIEYYFEVHDNDGVNGSKSSRTQTMEFKAPTKEEIDQTTQKNNTEIKNDLEESINKAKQLQKDINEISKKINDKKQLGYEDKKKIEDLIKKQNELQNKIEQIKQENEQNNKQQNEFSQADESLLEKQKELEQLFENVMSPEMKKLFDELNKLLEKLDKNQVQEKLEEMKLSNKDIEKELDRNLELFKQLEVQQKMQEAIDKLSELQKKEEQLNKETEGKKPDETEQTKTEDKSKNESEKNKDNKKNEEKSTDKKADHKELEKKQDAINKDFEKLKEELKELQEKNNALEEPNALPKNEEKQNEISKELNKSAEELNNNNKKNASKSQKSAAQKMQEMQEEMESAMEENEEQQSEENAQALRQILENLLHLSFAQEELIKVLPNTRIDNPQYIYIPKQQNKLKDDSKMIEDSLLALSKRAPQISSLVNREITSIHLNMDKTVKALAERNSGESVMRMQGTMTSVNNLALLLNESLEQMQQQMKEQMKSKGEKKGKCKKPGQGSGKNPSSSGQPTQSLRKMQEQLNKQLQDMKDALEKGQKPGDKPGDKKGQKPGSGLGQNGKLGSNMPGSSEQFAKMAAQQEALRRQMQSLMDKLKNKGTNPGGDITNLMEQTEKELVNKQISNETMRRQQEILGRLLESEKAEREREQDEQRKSNEAKNQNLSNPEEFLEYKRLKAKEMELLNTVPPSLTPYFKEKVNNYFNNVNK